MASYAIMRAKKLNSMGTVAAALQHCYRERETPNADSERTPDNEHLAAKSTDEAMGQLRERLPEKRRKDAVLAVEYVMTASPEWWKYASQEEQAAFFDQAHKWLADKYGADNIITATIHRDETSPHLSAFVVPRTADGRLSAKEFIGNRSKMSADQTSFAEAVENLGLKRGIERSRATHQRVKTHYAAIQQASKDQIVITEEDLKPRVFERKSLMEKLRLVARVETPAGIATRLSRMVNTAFESVVARAAVSAQNEKRTQELRETLDLQQRRLRSLEETFEKGLSSLQVSRLAMEAMRIRKENERQEQERREQERQERQRRRGRGGYSR